jgi:hypothetical protein
MQESIYFFTKHQFTEYIKTITRKAISVPEALTTFRELKVLPKEFKTMTVQQLSDNTAKIMQLFTELRTRMKPECAKLPYNRKAREQELVQDLAENYRIDINAARIKIVIESWPPKPDRDQFRSRIFSYILEVAIAPRSQKYGVPQIEFIGSINSVPGIDGGETYFQDGSYLWMDRDDNQREATSVKGILSECGFNSIGSSGWKKAPCVVFINLITLCPEWLGSAGKTHINLTPYQHVIATTVSSLAYKMPSVRTNPGASFDRSMTSNERTGEHTDYLKDFLKERKKLLRQILH